MELRNRYYELKNYVIKHPEEFSKYESEIEEIRSKLIKEYQDYLYSHIEWEHIEMDAKTDNLSLISFNQLESLAINYDYLKN